MKKQVSKQPTAKPKVFKPKHVPMEVETIHSEKVNTSVFAKYEILTKIPLPFGHVRCICLKDFNGMIDNLRAGDIIDLPDRRYKSLMFRGLVAEYTGNLQPNKNR